MRLIVDTDTAGDDVTSLILALRTPGVSVEAITIAQGNVGFAQHAENALATLEACGRGGEIPVYLGAELPLVRSQLDAAYVFGRDGMSDSGFPLAIQRPAAGYAPDDIVRRLMAEPGEIDLLAQAPLTNIALAVQREPAIAKACRHLWIMGGTDNGVGNVTPAAEYNFYADPEAAKIVLAAGFDVTLVTWTLTLQDGFLDERQLAELVALDTPAARFFTAVNRIPLAFSKATQGLAGSLHPDAIACAVAIDQSLILKAGTAFVDVETQGELTRGYLSVSHDILPEADVADPDLTRHPDNARIIRRIDRDGFFRRLKAALG